MILINFSSLRVAGKLSKIYHQESYEQLEYASSKLVDFVEQNVNLYSNTKKYRDLESNTGISKADFLRFGNYDYAQLDSVPDILQNLIQSQKDQLEAGQPVKYGFGRGSDDGRIVLSISFQ